ncbi:hypothetical protein Pcinc_002013 [Petrolisthes cinctipes]|uniref:Uncharacterized protein n=1 Tax=Petrolisthes cinctipes TaxID=88211 RepID=A0AAE1GLX5_PETCI|nr:hypothetical protein Pcinc_002013 [Petrolisthes cinctipes]
MFSDSEVQKIIITTPSCSSLLTIMNDQSVSNSLRVVVVVEVPQAVWPSSPELLRKVMA